MTAFDAPGPGRWALDRSHYPGGTTPVVQRLMCDAMDVGMARVMEELGSPAQTIQARFVRGFMYTRLLPLIGADKPSAKLPPLPVLKIATRVHPEFRKRNKTAQRALANPPATAMVARWHNEIRPDLVARNRAFQETDLRALSDDELLEFWERLYAHAAFSMETHFWLHGYDLGPIALYVTACLDWGIEARDALAALTGASPSTREPKRLLFEIKQLVTSGGYAPATLADVRAHSPKAAELLDEYLADRRFVIVTRYDIDGLLLDEMPEVVLSSILSAEPPSEESGVEVAEQLRRRVPESDRVTFDEHLALARSVMDMRDDNGPITIEWVAGLLRRTLLEIASRLVAQARLADRNHVFDLRPEEVGPLLADGTGPSPEVLRDRHVQRHADALLDPPQSLGPEEAEPPLTVLPVAMRTIVRAIKTSLEQLGMSANASGDPLAGAGIGTEVYRGVVRRAETPEEAIERMEPGDVLVVRATSPAFNSILAIAGAVVTADGGPMSHAAVLARELGIPAIVGASGALGLRDGSLVEVDPVQGRVRVLDGGS